MIKQELIGDFRIKWNRIRENMLKEGADGCLLNVGINLFYTTGLNYNGYFYLPAEGEPWFFVKRPNGLTGDNVVYIRKPEQLPEVFAANGLKMPEKLMLEADELTYSEYMRLLSAFRPKETANATAMLRKIRQIKTPYEISETRRCAALHAAAYSEIAECFRPGMTDLQFQYEIERRMRIHGSLGLFRTFGANMDIFMGSILAGDNAQTPSPFDFALGGGGEDPSCPIGANGTPLLDGTAILIDMAGNFSPYMTDMSRVFAVGKLTDEAYRAHQVALQIQSAVEEISRPDTPCADIYNISVKIAAQEGFSDKFMGTKQQAKFVGHGVGLQINELPVLTPRSKDTLEEGMIFALEPKFVIPQTGAVGIENTYLVTHDGIEKLTIFPEEIQQL